LTCDPYLTGDVYRLEFEVAAGRYVAEDFEYLEPEGGTDILALRIRREDVPSSSLQGTPGQLEVSGWQ